MNFPNYPQRFVHGRLVQFHFAAAIGDIVLISMINWGLILAAFPNCWCIRTWLAGTWADLDHTAWLNQVFGNQPRVLRGELEPSNGWCVCHGRSGWGNASPPADTNSILMSTPEGLLAGHVQKKAAEQVSVLVAAVTNNSYAHAYILLLP